jgi:hypothetical protein
MNVADDLEKWLRKEASERTAAAISRRGYARDGFNSTDKDRKAAHALAEKMLGRKIPKTTRAEEEESAVIQERIAAKLDKEAAKLLGFADFVARDSCI